MIPKDELNHTTLGLVTFKSNCPSAKDSVRISPIKKHILYVTGFVKRVFHTHPSLWTWRTVSSISKHIQTWNFLHLLVLTYVYELPKLTIVCMWKTPFRKSGHIYSLLLQDPDILITPTAMVLYPQNLRFNITYSLGSIDDVSKVNMTFPIRVDVIQSPVSLLNTYL